MFANYVSQKCNDNEIVVCCLFMFFAFLECTIHFRSGMFARELLDQFIKSASSWTCISSKYQLIKCVRSFSVLAQLRTCTTHKHRSWNVPILPSIQSVQDEKCPFHQNCYRIAKTCKNVYICTFSIPKNMSGCCKLLIFSKLAKGFQDKSSEPIWACLPQLLKMTELTLRTIQSKFYGQFKPNRETNIDKIMLPLPTFCGNKWIDTQLILGLFSRGLKSQQFSRMWTNGLRQFSWTVWE